MRLLAAAVLLLTAAAVTARSPHIAFVNDAAIQSGVNPATLADFHFFSDPARQVPVKGVTPYRLNTPLWSDGADKLRFVYVPDGQQALAHGEGLLKLPVGSALIKTFRDGRAADRNARLAPPRSGLGRATLSMECGADRGAAGAGGGAGGC